MVVNVVARPVCSKSQMPIANRVMAEPINETSCPIQMIENAGIPVDNEAGNSEDRVCMIFSLCNISYM
jgi:hypothetical protein